MEFIHDKENKRFYTINDDMESELTYTIDEEAKVLDFNHTYVPNELRGRGIAKELVEEGIRYAKEIGYKIIPSCPYVLSFAKRYKEYKDFFVYDDDFMGRCILK